MTDCVVEAVDKLGEWTVFLCKVCGRRRNSKRSAVADIHFHCAGYPVPDNWRPPPLSVTHDGPGFAKRLVNFTLASIQHAMAGMPTCTQTEIAARYDICRACELYKPDKDNPDVGRCTHEKCGCGVSGVEKFVSKLAWRDQDCPLGKWPAID